jgi:hypothetical protein
MSHLAVPSLRIAAIGAGSSSGDEVISSARVGKFASVETGTLLVGTTISAGAAAGDVVLANGRDLRSVNGGDTGTQQLIGLDSNNIMRLAGAASASNTGGYVRIGHFTAVSLSVGISTLNGAIVLDDTNNRLVYYLNGNRYHLTGTAF